MKAAEKGHEKVVEALMSLKAEINLENSVSRVCFIFFLYDKFMALVAKFSAFFLPQ
jgi:hypothetical protein